MCEVHNLVNSYLTNISCTIWIDIDRIYCLSLKSIQHSSKWRIFHGIKSGRHSGGIKIIEISEDTRVQTQY